jgi:hypothetical protein
VLTVIIFFRLINHTQQNKDIFVHSSHFLGYMRNSSDSSCTAVRSVVVVKYWCIPIVILLFLQKLCWWLCFANSNLGAGYRDGICWQTDICSVVQWFFLAAGCGTTAGLFLRL